MRSPRAWSYSSQSILAILVLAACPGGQATTSATDSDPSTDTQSSGSGTNSTDECPIGGLGCPCTNGGGCDKGLVCAPDDTCVSGEATTTVDPSTTDSTTDTPVTTETSSSSSDTSSSGNTEHCDPAEGLLNFKCTDPEQPYCGDTGTCGGCGVLPIDGCEQINPSTPVCDADTGKCVACTFDNPGVCGGDTPACDLKKNECVGCIEHSDCAGTACDVLKGECFPADKVLYIRFGVPGDDQNVCTDQIGFGGTLELPYCHADFAIQHSRMPTPTSGWTFKFLMTSFPTFHNSVHATSVDEPVSYAFVHDDPGVIEDAYVGYDRRFEANDPVFTVGSNVTVYIQNFALRSKNMQSEIGVGVACQPKGTVFLDDSFISDARGPGIRSNGCDVYLRRSSITRGKTEAIELNCANEPCELHMVNSFIARNQFFLGEGGGGIKAENAVLDIAYSTILDNNNEVAEGNADSIQCVGGNVTGEIRNSVIGRTPMGNLLGIQCDPGMLNIHHTLLDSEAFEINNNKKIAGEDIIKMFQISETVGTCLIDPKALNNPDAELALAKVAVWKKGDPMRDYAEDPRNAKDGQFDFVGGDVPSP